MNTAQTAIDFAPLLDQILQLAGLLLAGLVAWATKKAKDYFETQTNIKLDAQACAVIDAATTNAVKFAQAKLSTAVKGTDVTVDVKHPVIAEGVSYMIQHVPDALQRLGVTQDQLAQKLLAKLPQ